MQLPTLLVESIKSGCITVSQRDVPQLEIKVENKKIDINATDKQLIKEIASASRERASKGGVKQFMRQSIQSVKAASGARPMIKDLVEDFCKEGITVTLSYKGDKVATIGSEANSKLTRLATGTKGIEINSPRRLAELGLSAVT